MLALPGEPIQNLDGLDVELERGNVLSIADCQRVTRDVDAVFHAAAVYQSHMPDPTPMYEVNHRGTFNMLEACRRAGVGKVVYTASMVALGRPPAGTIGNEDTRYDAWDIDFAYSRSKYHSRVIAEDFAAWGLDVRIVCPGMVLGPGDVAPTPSGQLVIETVRGGLPFYMDGGAAYVDVRDAANVHVKAAERGRAGERYLATGHNLSNKELLMSINRAAKRKRVLAKLPVPVARSMVTAMNVVAEKRQRPPQIPKSFFEYGLRPSYFDNTKSRKELGVTYRSIDDTLGDALDYFREQGYLNNGTVGA